jgi:hypothetical protein
VAKAEGRQGKEGRDRLASKNPFQNKNPPLKQPQSKLLRHLLKIGQSHINNIKSTKKMYNKIRKFMGKILVHTHAHQKFQQILCFFLFLALDSFNCKKFH